MTNRFRSLQVRLAVRLAALYIVAMAIAVAVLLYQAYDTAGTLNDRELTLRAADLARSVTVDAAGAPHLALSPKLAAAYATGDDVDIFAIRTGDGHVVAASPPSFGERVAAWPAATDEPSYFRLRGLDARPQDYDGLSIEVESAAGPLSVSVAASAESDALVHSLLREFVFDIAWIIPILVAVTLAIGVMAIRSGLAPVREASAIAAGIGPGSTSIRLPEAGLPSEIAPLVAAMNRALDRLDRGFAVQREFTANAAHELRTPLAIITAALDAMEGNGDLAKLRSDVGRMNRLVAQLLHVARLDAVAPDMSGVVDLREIAASLVATMAPWAVAQRRAVAFAGPDQPVPVKGNAHAIEDAIRNLVENAVIHSAIGEEVTVTAHRDGSVDVADRGPGIPIADRDRIFDRFWRGKDERASGAGLGLAIVRETMKLHGGTVAVADNPAGGAVFTLRFPFPGQGQQ